ncbi:hypothetical protein [Pseudomonas serbica]|uniref:hypothetical protein n=1 Tax=Pseudomonas serbica TaxID=2965074 RepID=UPI00237B9A6B|nr:hypothetical protein [Pseudomonas serbica]
MSKVNGTVVKERLESLVEQAALEERTAKNSLKSGQTQLAQTEEKMAAQLGVMARVHLQTLIAGNTRLHPITQEVATLLSERKAGFEAAKAEVGTAEEAVEQADVALRTAHQTLASREAQLRKDLESHEGLKDLRGQIGELSNAVNEKEELLENITNECVEKSKAYREDRFFMHLHNIQYGTENSTSKWLFRGFDNWLAQRINYTQAQQNFKFLYELPVRANEALTLARQQLETVQYKIQEIVDQIEESSGQNQAEVRLESAEKRLKERQDALKAVREAVDLHTTCGDQAYKQILAVIGKAMDGMSLQTLDRLTGETDNREDELALSSYRSLYESGTRLRGEIAAMQNRHENAAYRYKRASSLQEYCDDQGLDSSKRIYNSNFNLQSLVDGYMIGQIEQSMLGRQLETQSEVIRERAPEPSYTPPTSSGYSSGYAASGGDDDNRRYRNNDSISSSESTYKNSDSISDNNSSYSNGETF